MIFPPKTRRRDLMRLVCALTGALLIATRSAGAADTQAPGRGELLLCADGVACRAAVQLHTKVQLQISGMVAQVQLEQRFRNATDSWLEGVYVFPLADNAAVDQLRLVMSEREIIGEIRERAQAKKLYRQARSEGRKAGLVEQQRPNMFTSRVANVAPGEEVVVHLRYVQRIDYHQGEFSLRIPLTITPRYIPGRQAATLHSDSLHGWAAATDLVPDAAAITPPLLPGSQQHSLEISAEIDVGMPLASVESAYHAIKLTRSEGRYKLQLAQGANTGDQAGLGSPLNRDFLLRWRPQAGSEPQAALFQEQRQGQRYALLMVVPPQQQDTVVLPREIVFVIDTSGSMGGTSIIQARQSLQFALGKLRARDRFNIIAFNSSARGLFGSAQLASSHNLARAREFVRHLHAGGGTEMLNALQLALRDNPARERAQSAMLRQLVFITDGAVGNEAGLFREIQQRLGRSRLFTVGIGSAPNSWFMRKAAEVGRGYATFIGVADQVQDQMQALFEILSAPLVSDIDIQWPQAVESYPSRISDLYRGQPLLVAARLHPRAPQSPAAGTIIISGRSAGGEWQRQLALPAANAEPASGTEMAHAGIASIWARQKIDELLDGKVFGKPESDIRAAVVPVALAHQLLSPYTSFVAIEQRRSRAGNQSLASAAVPNLPPRGQTPQPYAWPGTATGVNAQLAAAMGFGLLALLVWGLQQPVVLRARRK